MAFEESVQIVKEAIDAHGLGYAIQTGGLSANDVSDPVLSELIKTASDAMSQINKIVKY